ncbi:Integrase core domain [Popillia japonica]|uniref:RNA-directed DNA polymerase n=1 Tax=Popillia japonica TaxID=7064 RepID=A0AAW1JC54_POPJA
MRWSLLLQEFQYTIEHVPGKDNQLPDALSRNPEDVTTPPALGEADRLVPRSNTTAPERRPDQVFLVQEEEPLLHAIQDAQQSDPQVQNIIRRLQAGTPDQDQEFSFSRGFVRYKNGPHHRIAVPRTAQPLVLHRYHDDSTAGHPGIEETSRVITQRFHWPTIRTDIAEYIRGCRLCNAFKRGPIQAAAPLRPHAPKQPFEVLSVDLIGPLTESRSANRFGIVAMDIHSRWTEAQAARSTSAEVIIRFLDTIFQRFGYPMAILTDNGPQFTSVTWDAALRRWQCLHWTTPIYHPRANPVERRNQELKKGLRLQLEGKTPERWDEKLSQVLFNLRSRQNAATKLSPAKALFGYELRRPGEWRDPIPEEVQPQPQRTRAIHANERRYRERRYARPDVPMPIQPKVGDLVMVRGRYSPGRYSPGRPFAPRWMGPYPVVDTAGQTSLWVEQPGARRTKQHLDDVRLARPGNTAQHPAHDEPPERLARPGNTAQHPAHDEPPDPPASTPEPTAGPSWAPD